jgi:predicted protein tyrosine phosphatase
MTFAPSARTSGSVLATPRRAATDIAALAAAAEEPLAGEELPDPETVFISCDER